MPTAFSKSTAEMVIQVVSAIHAKAGADVAFVEKFCDLTTALATDALGLATQLGLIRHEGAGYEVASQLALYVASPDERRRASIIRLALESFRPFVVFRMQLISTGSTTSAATRTKALLDLDAHREDIKDTLINLGTYTGAIVGSGGGQYDVGTTDLADPLQAVVAAANDLATAEQMIRKRIGMLGDQLERQTIILPLAEAFLQARLGQAQGAVVDAARAVESFLAEFANMTGVDLAGAAGLGTKLDRFRPGNFLPKKNTEAAKYLVQVRNAADHGVDVDPEVQSIWEILPDTGVLYVLFACSFICSALRYHHNQDFSL